MSTYFQARRMTPDFYDNYSIPKYILDELPQDKQAKILDIGCGFGQFLKQLSKNSYTQIYGIDIDKQAVENCKRENLNVALIEDLYSYIKSSDTKYDFILMSHVIEHLKKDEIIPILAEIYKNALNKGGKIMIMTPNAQSLIGSYWAYEDFTHNTIFTSGSLYYVLKMAGFDDIKFLDIYNVSELGLIKKLMRVCALKAYGLFFSFRNKITANPFYQYSEKIFSWELKAVAKK
jgi:SAM-dependent methyltransferase